MEQLLESLKGLFTTDLSGLWIILSCILLGYIINTIIKICITKYVLPKASPTTKSWLIPGQDVQQFLVFIIAAFIGAKLANIDVTIILALTAIITAGISLSLDTNFKNALAAYTILTSGHFKIGDTITVDGLTGEVQNFTLFSISLYVPSNGVSNIPNSKLVDGIISNHTKSPTEISIRIPIITAHNRKEILSLIKETVLSYPKTVPGSVKVLHNFDVGGAEIYNILLKIESYKDRKTIASDISILVSNVLEEKGLELGEYSLVKQG